MALKHYRPHGYATRYACGANVKPGAGTSYSDEVTCKRCLEKLKIAHETGSLEGDFDIEDDWVGTAKRRYNVGEVRKLVRKELRLVERRIREAELSDGSKSPWGSKEHVRELRASIADLERYRNQQRRGSDARATYTRALQRLKAQLRSAENAAAKQKQQRRS